MFNVQRLLGPKIYDLIDRMSPGGTGDPFTGLNTHERGELANLYRLGYPRGDEFMIEQPMGQAWLWASYAERLQRDYPEYSDAFWTKPGHVGFDEPQHVLHDLIDVGATVLRPLYAKEVTEDARFQTPEYAQLRGMAQLFAGMHEMWDVPMALELDTVGNGYVLAAGVRLTTGQAAGRQLYCINAANTVLLCDGEGEASNLRLSGVLPGDEVHLDNHALLAYCYAYRHHLSRQEVDYDCLRVDDRAMYPQYDPEMSPFMGTVHTGRYDGKLMWVHHRHDSSLWPSEGRRHEEQRRARTRRASARLLQTSLGRECGARAAVNGCVSARAQHQHPFLWTISPTSSKVWWISRRGWSRASIRSRRRSNTRTARSPFLPPPPSEAGSSRSSGSRPMAPRGPRSESVRR